MSLCDSQDGAMKDTVPDIRTDQKWDAVEEVKDVESHLYFKNILE